MKASNNVQGALLDAQNLANATSKIDNRIGVPKLSVHSFFQKAYRDAAFLTAFSLRVSQEPTTAGPQT